MELSGYGNSGTTRLDATFAALADPTRRAILARLASGEASVNELAEPFEMSQPAISKHLKVLERAGLISRGLDAQRRPRKLEAKPLAEANEWLEQYRQFWEASFGRLDALLLEMTDAESKASESKIVHSKSQGEETWAHKTPRKIKEILSSMNSEKLQITTPSDREIAMTRVFNAPRRLVFDALTKPELVKRWLLGPPGWSMPVCEIDLRVGGKYRYVWRQDSDGTEMGMGGVYREIVKPERIVATEKFDQSWYSGEAVGTARLVEHGGKTTLTQTMLYESKETRDAVLKSPMESGVSASYDRLADVLAATGAGEIK